MRTIPIALVVALTSISLSSLSAKDTHHRTVKSSGKSHAQTLALAAPAAPVPTSSKFNSVVIDAGHGGHDPGGIPENIIPEKDVALDIARRLSYALEESGLKPLLTREDDTFIPLQERVNVSNAQDSAIFVSIHFNAAPRREARGVETYYSNAEGAVLAARIQHNIASTTSGDDRGIKAADFYVLRKNKDLCVLVECGFLTNPEDVDLALNDDYREKVAQQICAAIVDYRNSLPGKEAPLRLASLSDRLRLN